MEWKMRLEVDTQYCTNDMQRRRRLWEKENLKYANFGTSLVVQWLRICLPMQGMLVQSLVWELRSHMPRAGATKPACHNWREARLPQLRPDAAKNK